MSLLSSKLEVWDSILQKPRSDWSDSDIHLMYFLTQDEEFIKLIDDKIEDRILKAKLKLYRKLTYQSLYDITDSDLNLMDFLSKDEDVKKIITGVNF